MDEIDKDFIKLYRQIGSSFGLDDLFMTVFAKLYIEPEEVAMEDLARETGYSLASISNTAKMFVPRGMIKRSKKPGSRKIYLSTEKDFTKILKDHMLKKEQHGIKFMKENLPSMIKKFKDKVKTDKEKKKVKILENYLGQMAKFEIIIRNMIKELEKI